MRRHGGSICTTVDIDVDDVLGSISDDVLLSELRERGLLSSDSDLGHAMGLLRQGRTLDGLTLLERALDPKFSNLRSCAKAYQTVRQEALV